jgi:hypothetical protein
MKKAEIQKLIEDVEVAIKVIADLYPEAGGHDKPHSAGVVLRRLQLRRTDLYGFLDLKEE